MADLPTLQLGSPMAGQISRDSDFIAEGPQRQAAVQQSQAQTQMMMQRLQQLKKSLPPVVQHHLERMMRGEVDPETAAIQAQLGLQGHPAFQPTNSNPATAGNLEGSSPVGGMMPDRGNAPSAVSDTRGQSAGVMPAPEAPPASSSMTFGDLEAMGPYIGSQTRMNIATGREENRNYRQTASDTAKGEREDKALSMKNQLEQSREAAAARRQAGTIALGNAKLGVAHTAIVNRHQDAAAKLDYLQKKLESGRLDKADMSFMKNVQDQLKQDASERNNLERQLHTRVGPDGKPVPVDPAIIDRLNELDQDSAQLSGKLRSVTYGLRAKVLGSSQNSQVNDLVESLTGGASGGR